MFNKIDNLITKAKYMFFTKKLNQLTMDFFKQANIEDTKEMKRLVQPLGELSVKITMRVLTELVSEKERDPILDAMLKYSMEATEELENE